MLTKNLIFGLVVAAAFVFLVFEVMPGPRRFSSQPKTRDLADLRDVADSVDLQFQKRWSEKQIQSVGKAAPLIVARRLSLGLTGTIPSLEEIRQFEKVDPENQIDWWVNYLLDDQRYADYVAERLARSYVGVEDGPFIVFRRRRFVSWLSEQLNNKKPYDQLVSELIVNNGLWTDSPSVNFYTVTINNQTGQPDPVRLAARTSRAFLGMRIDCLQCHDDALGTIELGNAGMERSGTQSDFHQLAAAFHSTRQTAAGLQDASKPVEYLFKYLDKDIEEVIPFEVPFRSDLLPTEGSHRQRLATWLTHKENPAFPRAIVNRVWGIMAGRPLYDPVDDIPLHGNLPPGLETLAEDFVENGYDLKRLIRIIAQTEAFQNSSTANFQVTDLHESLWAVFPQNPLRPEQVVGSLVQATSLTTINDQSNVFQKLITFGSINDFINRYGDTGEEEFRKRNETIQQKNIMMNGQIVFDRTQASGLMINAAGQIARFCDSDETAIETLFLVTLSRRPTPVELEHLVSLVAKADTFEKKCAQLEDILWAIFNKLEFLRNH